MIKINKIYTKKGDSGFTRLGDGSQCEKNNFRIKAIGAIDETNAAIGISRIYTKNIKEIDDMLLKTQNDLFDLGADLAISKKNNIQITNKQIKKLENNIDLINSNLSELKSFILPGGLEASSFLHLARTFSRRAEINIVSLYQVENINPLILCYINRLSDFLFVIARITNKKGKKDVLWISKMK